MSLKEEGSVVVSEVDRAEVDCAGSKGKGSWCQDLLAVSSSVEVTH